MKKTLYICILATSVYNEYIPYFLTSLQNFKLNKFNIQIIILSNVKQYGDEYLYYPIAHFPYTFNTYLKPFIIQNALQYFYISDDNYIMYVDADTIIRKCKNYNQFEKYLLTDQMIFSISPWSVHSEYYEYENSLCQYKYPEVYIEDLATTDYLQGSFFAGKIDAFNKFCYEYFSLVQLLMDDWKNKRIPPLMDQTIINKIVYNNPNLYIKDYLLIDDYSDFDITDAVNIPMKEKYILDRFILNNYPNIFLVQKFNQYIKAPIRKSV